MLRTILKAVLLPTTLPAPGTDRPVAASDGPKLVLRSRAGMAAALLAVVVAVAPVVWSMVDAAGSWRAVGDSAAIVLRSRDVFTSDTPLVGMPTALSESVGEQVHHPGPLEFWVLGAASAVRDGDLVPALTAGAVNVAAVAGIVLWCLRRAGPGPGLAIAVLVAASLWPLRGEVLIDPWNPFAALLPFAAFLVAMVAGLGGARWAAPVAAVAGSYAAQAHLTLCLLVVGLTGLWLAWAAVHRWSRRREEARVPRPSALASLTVGLVLLLWSPVLVDQVARDGNLGALLSAPGDQESAQGWDASSTVLANALALPPAWASTTIDPFRLLADPELGEMVIAVVVAASAVAVAAAGRHRQPLVFHLVVVSVAGLAMGALLTSRIPESYLNVYSRHNYLWLRPITALLWAGLVTGVAVALRDRGRLPSVAAAIGVALLCSVVVVNASGSSPVPYARVAAMVEPISATLRSELDQDARYLVHTGVGFEVQDLAGGVLLELERAGFDVVVDDELAPSFGEHRSRRGRVVAGTVLYVFGASPPPMPTSDSRLLATWRPAPEALRELDEAQEVILRLGRREGDDMHELRRSLEDGSFAVEALFGRASVSVPRSALDRLLRAQVDDVLHVAVFLVPGVAPTAGPAGP